MKNKLLLFSFYLLISNASNAQNNILAGKITDENNIPLPNVVIQLQNGDKHIVIAKTNDNGLYYTPQLPPGNYSITIISNGGKRVATKISITTPQNERQFYNFCLKDRKAIETITTEDPFISTALALKENEDPRKYILFGRPGRNFFIQTDKFGKIIGASLPSAPPPRMK